MGVASNANFAILLQMGVPLNFCRIEKWLSLGAGWSFSAFFWHIANIAPVRGAKTYVERWCQYAE
jgi:hypothetical protein